MAIVPTVDNQNLPMPPAPTALVPAQTPDTMTMGTPAPGPLPGVTGQNAPIVPAPTAAAQVPFSQALSANVNAAADATHPAVKAAPSSWARQLVAGALASLPSAVKAVQTSLGDAAGNVEGHEGLFGALGEIQRAKGARIAAEQKQQTEEDFQRAQIQKINADTHYQETLLHSLEGKQADAANDEAIANGNQAVQLATSPITAGGEVLPGASVIQKDISEAQLQQALNAKGPDGKPSWDPNRQTFWATGKQPVYENGKQKLDASGNPVWGKTYTIIATPKEITLDDNATKFLNANISGAKFQAGTKLPGALALSQFQQANNNHALIQKQQEERDEADLKAATTEQKLAQVQASKNLGPEFFPIAAQSDLNLSKTMNFITGRHLTPGVDPSTGKLGTLTDPETGQAGFYLDPRSVEYAKNHPSAGQDLVAYMGGLADYTKIRDAQEAEIEKARHDRAEEQRELKAEQDKKTADLNDQTDAFGNKSPLSDKEFNKRYDAFTASAQNKTVQTLAGSYQQFNSILNDVNQGKMTPADSVVGLLAAIGISATPLAGKGFRINSNVIDEHIGAQQGGPGAAKLRQLSTGDILSAQQLQDYARISADVYKQSYLNAANEQRRTLGYVDILPRGNNQQIDPMTASMYLQIAGNNPQLAAQAAQKQGWQATPQNFGGKSSLNSQAVAGTLHSVVVGGKIVGYTNDGGKTMTTNTPAGFPAVGSQAQ